MIQIGSGSERKKPIFLLRDGAPFRILGELKNSSWSKKLKTSKYTVRGRWGGGRVSSFQVPRSVADIYPIISATLSRAASCCFCSSLDSEKHEDPRGVEEGRAWSGGGGSFGKIVEKAICFYIYTTLHISRPAAIWFVSDVLMLWMFVW